MRFISSVIIPAMHYATDSVKVAGCKGIRVKSGLVNFILGCRQDVEEKQTTRKRYMLWDRSQQELGRQLGRYKRLSSLLFEADIEDLVAHWV